MSEPKKDISRRDFLKLAGLAAGAMAFTACTREEMETVPEYKAVENGTALLLKLPGKLVPTKVSISYSPIVGGSEGYLQVRMVNGESKIVQFKVGAVVERAFGEICDNTLLPVKKNSSLGEDVTVQLYPDPWSNDVGRRIDLPTEEDVYAISAITLARDWVMDGTILPVEIKANPSENFSQSGKGYAVGKYEVRDGQSNFVVLGWVYDARALEVVKKLNLLNLEEIKLDGSLSSENTD